MDLAICANFVVFLCLWDNRADPLIELCASCNKARIAVGLIVDEGILMV